MADRLLLYYRTAGHGQGARLAADGAKRATARARLLRAQGAGLLLEQDCQCALGESGSGRAGQLLQGVEVHVQTGTLGAESAAGDDFAPAGGQVTDFTEELRRKL